MIVCEVCGRPRIIKRLDNPHICTVCGCWYMYYLELLYMPNSYPILRAELNWYKETKEK
jgi:hypothetical protein